MVDRLSKSRKPSATKAELLLNSSIFFIDRCLGRQIGVTLREKGLRVELHEDHYADNAADSEWLVDVGSRGWVVLTKDKTIRRKPLERQAVITANVKMFTLPNANLTGAEMAEIFVSNLLGMGRFLKDHKPPFIASVSRNGIKTILVGEEAN